MSAYEKMTSQEAWPLSVFLTPDQVPLCVVKYIPKESMDGKPGFKDVIAELYDKYKNDREGS
ncbi:hypothetical protein BKP35_09530 [Anaerobacillus arseniciselenatis]|uniref:Spermatogenesis-associated protein 20-like TRX domain-containing protein n=2 Tax=Anaerobacillus arseniciselenatis TaxID=85682 RepID=A0A1S2LJU9_9BACI|nr:hypothetical protein BKP35_09530 [Anaerobacillus arseniciselenatis]